MKHKIKGNTCSCSTAFWAAASTSWLLSNCSLEPLDLSCGCRIANSETSALMFWLLGEMGCRWLTLDAQIYCGSIAPKEEEPGPFESGRGKRRLPEPAATKEDELREDDELGRDSTPGGSGSSTWSPIKLRNHGKFQC